MSGAGERGELGKLVRAAITLVDDAVRAGLEEDLPFERLPCQSGVKKPARSNLTEIRAELGDCTRCKLHAGRTNIVFGTGSPDADLLFVGEGPGRDEDLKGEPFVGRAGKLLDSIIEAIGLHRAGVYICNVVKCRPPQNRNPEPDEIAACMPFLEAQIASVAPKVICALGKVAAQSLLGVDTPISRLRGGFLDYLGTPMMITYHPAYLLRNPSAKADVWEDMKKVHAELCRRTGRAIVRKGR